MALINIGALRDFSVKPNETLLKQKPVLFKSSNNFNTLTEMSRSLDPRYFDLSESEDKRGLALKKLELTEGFEGFLGNLFKKTNEVYFLAWTWDFSGQAINQYPEEGVNPDDVIIKLKAGNVRKFIGEGINLFPKRKVKGGIAVRIMLWESDKNLRDFGKTLSETADSIQKSELNNLLALISTVTGVAGATVALVEKAALELAKIIGVILKANSNDYVDLFEGYYASDSDWNKGEDEYSGNSSKIVLNKY